ncbi:hypothetical protein PGTUg99_006425 [Puccinia graminis f. sp. tritici]|uniref:Uncharacterized protein n=1 Tax=Puccinia graminis f. sp. tritici TaxID=56615 RepID=A0A5B0RPG7_PUCGR|nr:hypothetical protein PGTUg99_006425 [Puccinia graminis f. sp. tritici]
MSQDTRFNNNTYPDQESTSNNVPPSTSSLGQTISHSTSRSNNIYNNQQSAHSFTRNPDTHFLDKEPVFPKYKGTSTRSVKIKPMDKELLFDGTNMPVEKFIKRYENAGLADDASAQDLARQIISFIHGNDLKDEVEEMTGHEDSDWELLKAQLLNRFGSSLPLVKYSRQDLKKLVNTAIQAGGIKTLEEFKNFRTKFESVTTYLFRMGYSNSLEIFRELLLESLSPDLEASVTRELIMDNKMLSSMDGGDILPDTQIILAYIHREVQSTSVMERRKLHRMEPMEPTKELDNSTTAIKNPSLAPKPSTPACFNELEQKFEELTRKFEAYYSVKINPTHPSGPAPSQSSPPAPRKSEFKCYYCFLKGHGTRKCNSVLYDESIGAVTRDGKLFKLPDSTTIPWDTSRPIKQVVDQYSRNSVQLFSSFGQLVELSPEELRAHKADLAKRNISTWKQEGTSAIEKWTTQEKGILMEKDKPDLLNMANSSLKSSSPDLSSCSSYSFPQLSDNQFKDRLIHYSDIQHFPYFLTEEPPRKHSICTNLATDYPGSLGKTNQKLSVMDQDHFISYGGTLTSEHEFPEDLKKFPNRILPLEDNISENLGKSEYEDKQDLVAHHFGRLGLTHDGLGQHDLVDTGSIVGEINLLRNLSATFNISNEIQEPAAGLDIRKQLFLISVSLNNHQKWGDILPSRMATKDYLHQAHYSSTSQLFLSSQLMGTSAKLGEELTTRSLELKHFCCQKPVPDFLIICLKTSVLECGNLLQNSHPEAFHNLPLARLKFTFQFDGIGTSKLQFRKCCCQESPLENVLNWALTVRIKTFLGLGLPEGIDWFQNDMSHKTKFARGAWVDQIFNDVAKGHQTVPLTWLQRRRGCSNSIAIRSNITFVRSSNIEAIEVVTGSITYYILNCIIDQFASGHQRLPCLLGEGHVKENARYNFGLGYEKPRGEKVIDIVRTHVYSFNRKEGQVATTQRWRIGLLEKSSRQIGGSKLAGTSEVQRTTVQMQEKCLKGKNMDDVINPEPSTALEGYQQQP